MPEPVCRILDINGTVSGVPTNQPSSIKYDVAKICVDPTTLKVVSAVKAVLTAAEIATAEDEFRKRSGGRDKLFLTQPLNNTGTGPMPSPLELLTAEAARLQDYLKKHPNDKKALADAAQVAERIKEESQPVSFVTATKGPAVTKERQKTIPLAAPVKK